MYQSYGKRYNCVELKILQIVYLIFYTTTAINPVSKTILSISILLRPMDLRYRLHYQSENTNGIVQSKIKGIDRL